MKSVDKKLQPKQYINQNIDRKIGKLKNHAEDIYEDFLKVFNLKP